MANKNLLKEKTSAPTVAWKCIFPSFQEIITDRPTTNRTADEQTDRRGHREVTFPLTRLISYSPYYTAPLYISRRIGSYIVYIYIYIQGESLLGRGPEARNCSGATTSGIEGKEEGGGMRTSAVVVIGRQKDGSQDNSSP